MLSKNKVLSLLCALVLIIGISSGCSKEEDPATKNTKQKELPAPVLVEDIQLINPKILEPDSIGNIYYTAQFKNNSDKTITGIEIEYELDNKETSYLLNYDTLLAGDISTKTQCTGPTTGKVEDMKPKRMSIKALDSNKEYYIDYDYKLEAYDVVESKLEKNIKEPIVSVEDIEIINSKVLEPDSIGNIYFEAQFKNNSKFPITSIEISYELDNGETSYLSTYDTLLPGDTSTKAECSGPTTGKAEDMKIKDIHILALNQEDVKVNIEYDAKLKTYEVIEIEE